MRARLVMQVHTLRHIHYSDLPLEHYHHSSLLPQVPHSDYWVHMLKDACQIDSLLQVSGCIDMRKLSFFYQLILRVKALLK